MAQHLPCKQALIGSNPVFSAHFQNELVYVFRELVIVDIYETLV